VRSGEIEKRNGERTFAMRLTGTYRFLGQRLATRCLVCSPGLLSSQYRSALRTERRGHRFVGQLGTGVFRHSRMYDGSGDQLCGTLLRWGAVGQAMG
jgi:hypothetical protein